MGYGDYSGSTTIEYITMVGIEFIGIFVFAVFQICITALVTYDSSYPSFMVEKDLSILYWIYSLEKTRYPENLPTDLYEAIKLDLLNSYARDTKQIMEYDYYKKLSPKM